MKEIFNLIKVAAKKKKKSKYPKSETTPYNPWAVCTESAGREDKAKYERCVQDVKKQNRKKNKSKKKSTSSQNILEAAHIDVPTDRRINKSIAIKKLDELYQEAIQSAAKGDIHKLDIIKQMYNKILNKSMAATDPDYIIYADKIKKACPMNAAINEQPDMSMASGEIFNLIKAAKNKIY